MPIEVFCEGKSITLGPRTGNDYIPGMPTAATILYDGDEDEGGFTVQRGGKIYRKDKTSPGQTVRLRISGPVFADRRDIYTDYEVTISRT